MTDQPIISIVVTLLQIDDDARKTITQIQRACSSLSYEIIIKVSSNILHKKKRLGKICVIYSRDSGIYDGMNQAIQYCTAPYIQFINNGDKICVDAKIYKELEKGNDCTILGSWGIVSKGKTKLMKTTLFKSIAMQAFFARFCHQSMIFSKKQLESLNGFNTKYEYVADHAFIIEMVKQKYDYSVVPQKLAIYDLNGVTSNNRKTVWRERLTLATSHVDDKLELLYAYLLFLWIYPRAILIDLIRRYR